ncbi:neutral zinc metallopeptidase [Amycolatopsis benzoatilytica]|uniref:neutral zinc metallopeptidase n=1 Tax=Amycolatopsis benzoatilytica TaxID=346045 RepID=UPI0003664EC2|nr:neutral zinc metallopeptidase [Amycolatopsis benzoatilytica]
MTDVGGSSWPQLPPPVPPRRGPGRALGAVTAVAVVASTLALMGAVPHEVAGHAMAASGSPALSDRQAARPVRKTSGNPLLAKDVSLAAPESCDLPELSRDGEQLKKFYTVLADCLKQSWQPALEKAGEPNLPVKISVTLPKTSACGNAPSRDQAVAYYCGGDETIYAPTDWMLSDAGLNRARHLATIAHEYGHHVQRESGILDAASAEMSSPEPASDKDKAVVRRIELQANCFGALFLAAAAGHGSISRATANAAVADYGRADDSGDHGTRENQLAWAKAGYSGAGPAACDTWSAPSDQVS